LPTYTVDTAPHAAPVNLFDLDLAGMEGFFARIGEKPFRALQVVKWIHQHGVTDIAQMTNLSKELRARLTASACLTLPEIALEQASADGTRKWLVRLHDGNCIETVFIPEHDRGTLCISSQVGCVLNCTFCSTAQQGFNRNLTTAEIIGQLFLARQALGAAKDNRVVSNVVMMGMGEPLLNFENVVPALNLMLDDNAYGLSKRRVTLSTAGVVPALDRLREVSDVALAVSLHATRDELRDELVPLNKKYPIAELLAACRRYIADKPHRSITVEYVMLDGINDQPQHARELVRLLKDLPSKVNLIPFNPFPNSRYQRSSAEAIDRFQNQLIAAGVITVVRRTRGDDIDAACGQLAGQVRDRTSRSARLMRVASGVL